MPLNFLNAASVQNQISETFKISDEEKTAYIMENLPKTMFVALESNETSLDDLYEWVRRWDENEVLDAIQVLMGDGMSPVKIRDVLDSYCFTQDELKKKGYKLTKPLADSSTGKCKKYKLYDDTLSTFLDDRGIKISYNEITAEISSTGFNPKYNTLNVYGNLDTIVYSMLVKSEYFSNIPLTQISHLLISIAMKNCENPVKKLIANDKWDGKDYLEELYQIMNISADDQLSRVLIRKWLHQSLSLAINNTEDDSFGADGCLVLNGKQGIGKTRLLKALAMGDNRLYREGQTITADKDTTRRCLTTWLCELGEIEKTFNKMSPEDLKAFITQEKDSYRLPYGKKDINRCRRASMYATCNSAEFLVDVSGSRRYWVISIDSMDINKINSWIKNETARQLWLQIYDQYVKENPNGFRLTPEEQNQLETRNKLYSKAIDCEIEINDYLSQASGDRYVDKWVTSSEIINFIPQLKYRYNAQKVGRALAKIGVETRRVKGTTQYKVPIPRFPESIN